MLVHSEHTTPYQQRICMRCSAEAVDSVHHLQQQLLECDHQADLEALRLAQQPGSSIKQLMTLAYDASQVESLASCIYGCIYEVMCIAQADQ